MADPHRLIRSLIFLIFGILLGGGLTFEAYAETYTAPQRWSFQLSTVYVGDTALAACQAGAALYGYSNISVINLTATVGDCRNNATSSVFGSVQLASYCPALQGIRNQEIPAQPQHHARQVRPDCRTVPVVSIAARTSMTS
jgi:hypothetical protein